MGSKSMIAKQIVPIIQNYIDQSEKKAYIEPFVGGANVIDKIVCDYRVGFDINKYLIALLQYVATGAKLPDTISKEVYADVRLNKEKYEPWFVGCTGFLASYNGRFFEGYAGIVHTKAGTVRDYYDEAKRNLQTQALTLKNIGFACFDYRQLGFNNCVIYCDPPYAGTKGYDRTERFNHLEFWEIIREWSKKNVVIVSEQTAPSDFDCIWKAEITRTQDNASRFQVTEKLFKYAG